MSEGDVHWASAWVGEASVDVLACEERELVTERTSAKRLDDFVAGRLAARRALDSLAGSCDPGRWVGRDELGAIHVRRGNAVVGGWNVSITHADGLAIAAASERWVGIDVVTLEPAPAALRDETGVPEEHERFARWLEGLGSEGDCTEFTSVLLFAAKEAALKWLGVGLHAGLLELALEPVDRRHLAIGIHGGRTVVRATVDVDGARALVALAGLDDGGLRRIARDAARRTLRREFVPRGASW